MYDSIECQYKLPMPDDPKGYTGSHGFQTKDFECVLDVYIIDKDGQLFIERRETEWVEGDPKAKSLLQKFGYAKTIKTWLEPLNRTCTVQFYDHIDSNKTDYDYWIVYEAFFVNGGINCIELINFEAVENSERKKKDKEFQNKLRRWAEFTKTRRYKYLFNPYNKCIRFAFNNLHKVLSFMTSKIWRIQNFLMIK